MPKRQLSVTRIGQRVKRLYLAEWMQATDPELTAADISRATGIDKSNFTRWMKGTIPQDAQLMLLAEFFNLDDPESLLRHPDDDWISRFFRERGEVDRGELRRALETLFPKKRA